MNLTGAIVLISIASGIFAIGFIHAVVGALAETNHTGMVVYEVCSTEDGGIPTIGPIYVAPEYITAIGRTRDAPNGCIKLFLIGPHTLYVYGTVDTVSQARSDAIE